jgi:hypothetical protein
MASGIGQDHRQLIILSGGESTVGCDILAAEFGGQGTGQVGTIVFRAMQGVDDPGVRAAMQAVFQFTKVAGLEGVNRVESFWDPGGERLMSPKATTRRVACDNVAGSEDVESSVAVTLADRPSRSLRRAVVDVVEHERSNPARSRPFAEAQRRELAGSLLDRATDIAASLKRTGRLRGATRRPPGEIRVPKLVLHGPKIRSAQVQTAYAAAHCRSVRCQGFAGLVVDANSVEEVEREEIQGGLMIGCRPP